MHVQAICPLCLYVIHWLKEGGRNANILLIKTTASTMHGAKLPLTMKLLVMSAQYAFVILNTPSLCRLHLINTEKICDGLVSVVVECSGPLFFSIWNMLSMVC